MRPELRNRPQQTVVIFLLTVSPLQKYLNGNFFYTVIRLIYELRLDKNSELIERSIEYIEWQYNCMERRYVGNLLSSCMTLYYYLLHRQLPCSNGGRL